MRLCVQHQVELVELSPFGNVMRCPAGHDLDLGREDWEVFDTEAASAMFASGVALGLRLDTEAGFDGVEIAGRREVFVGCRRRLVKGASWRASGAGRRSR